MSGDEDSSEEEVYTDSLTSHTTASGFTTADILTSIASAVEDNSNLKPPSLTESQFSPDMPYPEGSSQPDLTQDGVFTQQPSDSTTQGTATSSSPEPPAPRRSARSKMWAPTVCFGKVYTYSTIISNVAESPKFRQTLYVPCYDHVPND